MINERSVQVWPRGTSFCVKGSIDDPDCLINRAWPDESRWHKPTDEERRLIAIEEYAATIQQREIYCCDSAMVTDAMSVSQTAPSDQRGEFDFLSQWDYDNVSNLRPDPSEWDMEECKAWLADNGYDLPEPNPWAMSDGDLSGHIAWADSSDDSPEGMSHEILMARLIDDINEDRSEGLETWREAVRDNASGAEIYEWYRVSSWLATELDDVGECVLDNDYGTWWGRQATGQALIMDGVLQKVAARHIK